MINSTEKVSRTPVALGHESAYAGAADHAAVVQKVPNDIIDVESAIAPQAGSLRYNNFEFVYRQDANRVTLVQQDPQTGEKIKQTPSEMALQQYKDNEFVARRTERETLFAGSQRTEAQVNATAAGRAGVTAPSQTVVAPAAPPAAPAIPVVSAESGGAASVNLSI